MPIRSPKAPSRATVACGERAAVKRIAISATKAAMKPMRTAPWDRFRPA